MDAKFSQTSPPPGMSEISKPPPPPPPPHLPDVLCRWPLLFIYIIIAGFTDRNRREDRGAERVSQRWR